MDRDKKSSILSLTQAAALIGCCSRTVQRLVSAGVLPATRIGLKQIVFHESDVREYIASRGTLRQREEAA